MQYDKRYPIYVVFSRSHQAANAAEAGRLNSEAKRLEALALRRNDPSIKASARQNYEWEQFVEMEGLTTEDSDPANRRERANYHRAIAERLRRIESIPFGKDLFLKLKANVFIVPRPIGDKCYCGQTYPFKWDTDKGFSDGKGDSYVWFNPDRNDDDVLFHELCHAYRYSVGKFNRLAMADNEYNTEEFYAQQMQNIYRSFRRMPLEYSYSPSVAAPRGGAYATKDEIYTHFLSHDDFVKYLEIFVSDDEYAKSVANSRFADYNPFRDVATLRRNLDQINRALNINP